MRNYSFSFIFHNSYKIHQIKRNNSWRKEKHCKLNRKFTIQSLWFRLAGFSHEERWLLYYCCCYVYWLPLINLIDKNNKLYPVYLWINKRFGKINNWVCSMCIGNSIVVSNFHNSIQFNYYLCQQFRESKNKPKSQEHLKDTKIKILIKRLI
jgi:hypothetical protein